VDVRNNACDLGAAGQDDPCDRRWSADDIDQFALDRQRPSGVRVDRSKEADIILAT
jgi:hypothetical protein